MRPVVVTAGATRNPVDAIRYLSAHSSGRTGGLVAAALAADGADVTMLASPEAWLRLQAERPADAARVACIEYGSTDDLLQKLRAWVQAHPGGLVVHAAAVGDYAVADRSAGKLPSGRAELVLRLRPTPKIIDLVRDWDPTVHLVSFKAAPPGTDAPELERIARAQLARTGSRLVFANVIGNLQGLVLLVDRDGTTTHTDRGAALEDLFERLRDAVGRVH
ncbi:MAG: hypothetical protein D6798_12110 [Deltaproteobacteria bacterium]|nr:MAG: hypothetical protein D6798_12110 [Deltaproteobacteria bacterium]